ncbi:MAG: SDR family NAD(P)-dependent oxidoreductase [Oscillospiraceae bacterium]|nr:SDR family NAD(P)-dependent oxidoreductase [Oscillospiraceae bacterium]
MKNIVITGSSKGLGFEMARLFKAAGNNVVINGSNQQRLDAAVEKLSSLPGEGKVLGFRASVTESNELQQMINFAAEQLGSIDIWINNAGVNQPMEAIWELQESEIDSLIAIDLKGAIMGSKLAMEFMIKQGSGAIYNVEGYGSNDAMMLGLNMYGTTKRAITHFTQALAKESEERSTGVLVGRLSPGIMITDFTVKALGGKENIELPEKTKKVYNILGDLPDVVANFLVNQMLSNDKNNAHIQWLTNRKAAWRFMTSGFNKRNFFE